MRKIKSTALLGAFVAVASLGAISHEAHGSQIVIPNGNTPPIISKELLPSTVYLKASIVPTLSFSSGTITLTISGASFLAGSYTISGAGPAANDCVATVPTSTVSDTLVFPSCSVNASYTYAIENVGSTSFNVTVPTSSNSIVLSYDTNNGDASTSTIAYVKQQLTVTPANPVTAYIDPSSLSTFLNSSYASGSIAYNSVSILNNGYSNNTTWISPYKILSSTMIFSFSGIPSSVSSVTVTDDSNSPVSVTPANGNASITFALASNQPPYHSSSSDTITFNFSNSGNIQAGTIVLSSITGIALNSINSNYINYPYLSTPQNFLSFSLAATQIYVPDALAPSGSNLIKSGYITISMPSSTDITTISVLNNPSASCPAPSLSNGLLTSTSTTGVYYIDLSQLAQACTGLSASAWQSGVPLVITIANAVPTQVTADAYATFEGMLKRIPVDVLNASNSYANFNY